LILTQFYLPTVISVNKNVGTFRCIATFSALGDWQWYGALLIATRASDQHSPSKKYNIIT